MFTQYGPWSADDWGEGDREAYGQRCFDILARHAPNVRGRAAALRGARPAGPRGDLRPRGRLDLPGRAGPRPDGVHATVPGDGPVRDPGRRPVPVRRRHAPRRRRDGRGRPQRGQAGAGATSGARASAGASAGTVPRSRVRQTDRDADSLGAARPPSLARGCAGLRQHDHADPGRGPVAAAARGCSGTRPPAARSTRSASRSRAATTRSPCRAPASPSTAGQARARRRAEGLQLRRLPQPEGDQGVRPARGRVRPRHHLHDARRGVHQAQLRPRVRRHLLLARAAVEVRRRRAHPAARARADPEPEEERLARAAYRRPTTSARATRSRTRRTRPGSAGATTRSPTSTRPSSGWESFWEAERLQRPRLDPRRRARGARHGAAAPRRARPQHRGPATRSSAPARTSASCATASA